MAGVSCQSPVASRQLTVGSRQTVAQVGGMNAHFFVILMQPLVDLSHSEMLQGKEGSTPST